jgi:N6-adenosine-specific RNA methylase IME4
MDAAAIGALPVEQLAAPHSLLVMWSTWPHLALALEVMRLWGFSYCTGGAWFKRTKSGGLAMGTGHVLRSASEPYLVGTIGRPRIVSHSERNAIETIVDDDPAALPDTINALRREHSVKPDEMRTMLERLVPHAAKVDLFARKPWPGQAAWGDEIEKNDGRDS